MAPCKAAGATQTAITGSAGVNTVTVRAGGTLLATGDLANGSRCARRRAARSTRAAARFSLGAWRRLPSSFTTARTVVGTVDGGAGLDTRVYDIDLNANVGALLGFEGLTKTGTGVLNINGPGATNLAAIEVLGGTLRHSRRRRHHRRCEHDRGLPAPR